MPDLPEVAVIMPTRGLSQRIELVHRALESVLSQEGVRALPIVVINGPDRDAALARELRRDSQLRLIELAEPSIPAALQAGREAVNTEWFSSLDDDDIYLPGALAARVEALSARPDCDTVVTNGLCRGAQRERFSIPDMSLVERDPLNALARGNWLLPGAWLCRSTSVGSWLFQGMPKALECTYLALRFALRGKLCFLDQPTIAWYMDTPASESKSRDYVLSQDAAIEQILKLPLPTESRLRIRRNLTRARHNIASLYLRERNFAMSWRWHLRSLTGPGGWRYLPFPLRLLLGALRR